MRLVFFIHKKASMRIFYVPIEHYEERYTEQWYRWWRAEFESLGIEYTYVDGKSLTNEIEVGSVLDAYGTNYYKASQLQNLILMIQSGIIKDDDVIFFADIWFPGIESLQYIRNVAGKKFKIAGILHAGTWDKNDFTTRTGMREWAKHIENGWLSFVDKVFVATEYHKQLIIKKTKWAIPGRIIVTGLPFDMDEVANTIDKKISPPKENIVVFPHRLDDEKRPWLFDRLAYDLRKTEWQFIKSKTTTKTKLEYYQLLSRAKIAVSFAEQETFGYAMLEALTFNCIPVVPNKLSYKEMICYKYKADSYIQTRDMVASLIKNDTVFDENDWVKADTAYNPEAVIKKMFENL